MKTWQVHENILSSFGSTIDTWFAQVHRLTSDFVPRTYEKDIELEFSLYQIIRDTLHLADNFPIHDDLNLEDIPGWDSMGWINIVNSLENHLQKELPLEKLVEISTILDLRLLVESQLQL